jgi:hypothetical protein
MPDTQRPPEKAGKQPASHQLLEVEMELEGGKLRTFDDCSTVLEKALAAFAAGGMSTAGVDAVCNLVRESRQTLGDKARYAQALQLQEQINGEAVAVERPRTGSPYVPSVLRGGRGA